MFEGECLPTWKKRKKSSLQIGGKKTTHEMVQKNKRKKVHLKRKAYENQ